MLFNNEDCILIKNMYLPEGYTAQKLLKEFQSKSWNKRSLLAKSLEDGKKNKNPGTIQAHPWSGRNSNYAYCAESVSCVYFHVNCL